jgi:hypothetical protein
MSRTRRLLVVLTLNLALVGALVAVGVAAIPWLGLAVALTIALVVAYHAIALIRKALICLRPA